MSALNYSKKQLQPLIDKYAINAETNTVFARIIQMFDGQPNYQLWGVKVVFSSTITIEHLEAIKNWADEQPQLIKLLSKNGNLICYSSKSDFQLLDQEIHGLNAISFVKHMISVFNTDQRKLLAGVIKPDEVNGVNALTNKTFKNWFDLFVKFNKLSGNTKKKVIHRISAERDANTIFKMLNDALKEKYNWNKDDLLAFVAANTPSCDVVINDKDIVVLNVKNYDDSKALCFGRTSWCITSSESQWKSYVVNRNSQQYFLFDFSKPEKDELAHVGFTITKEQGIYAAHSTSDQNLMNSGINYHGKHVNIQKVLKDANIPIGAFLKMKAAPNFKWSVEGVKEYVSKHSNECGIAYDKDNRIIVNLFNPQALRNFIGHTYIKFDNLSVDNRETKAYALIDFNYDSGHDKSIIFMYYRKDEYKIDTLNMLSDAFNANLKDDNYLRTIGIKTEDYLNREKVDPSILLHKLIDEGDVEGACDLIDKNEKVDVNYSFNDRRPIFSAIDARLHKVVGKLISHPKFDCNVDDGFGESLIQNLMFTFYLDSTNPLKDNEAKPVREMIEYIIDSGRFDLNYVDENEDTAINIACMNPNMLWLVEKLSAREDINVNVRNDIHWTALGNAIRKNNVKAVEILGRRPDLEVTDADRKLAKDNKIDLDKYLKPQPFTKVDTVEVKKGEKTVVEETIDADKYEEIFKKVFSSKG